ncbi:Mov34/MPN/PAD-1 family protein [Pseudomonas citronellolis]|uniref:Mov34/MPN/PAD-1 family protein n=1 Tax=Pseudomonas citronellolis TaxID=53408 RepID=UPI002FDB589E
MTGYPPARCDARSLTTFWDRRSTHRHHSVAKLRWAESNGMIRYIGEWHTHPQAYPRPSSTDVHEWQVLATDRTDGRALLALIVGFEDLYLEYIHASGGAAVDALCGADILYFFLWISWSEYCVTESV